MLNPTAWNWKGKAGFFWAGMCFLCFLWTYFRLPEPKGRTYGELDILFERKIGARKFRHTDVSPWTTTQVDLGNTGRTDSHEKNGEGHDEMVEKV